LKTFGVNGKGDIYAGRKQFSNVYQLQTAIQKSWDNIDEENFLKLLNPMSNRIFEVMSATGKPIKHWI